MGKVLKLVSVSVSIIILWVKVVVLMTIVLLKISSGLILMISNDFPPK